MRGLGYFDSQADAAKAYDTEARKVLPSLLEARPPAYWTCIAPPDFACQFIKG